MRLHAELWFCMAPKLARWPSTLAIKESMVKIRSWAAAAVENRIAVPLDASLVPSLANPFVKPVVIFENVKFATQNEIVSPLLEPMWKSHCSQ